MKKPNLQQSNPRREFLGTLATGAAVMGAALVSPFQLAASPGSLSDNPSGADAWFDKLKGKHRMVFDATRPHEIMPFAWPRIFLLTNVASGAAENDCSAVVVLRHDAIGYAMEDSLWAKYKFGELFKADDPADKKPATRNPFWKPQPGAFKAPGVGEIAIGINELQDSGVMFCACDVALTVYSAAVAGSTNQTPADVKKEWLAGILPGVQVVPSGVWAVGRAQEHGCTYCFAG